MAVNIYYQMPSGIKVWMPHKSVWNYPPVGATVHLITGTYIVVDVKHDTENGKIFIHLDYA